MLDGKAYLAHFPDDPAYDRSDGVGGSGQLKSAALMEALAALENELRTILRQSEASPQEARDPAEARNTRAIAPSPRSFQSLDAGSARRCRAVARLKPVTRGAVPRHLPARRRAENGFAPNTIGSARSRARTSR